MLTAQGLLEISNPTAKSLIDFFKACENFRPPKSSIKRLKGALAFFEPSSRTQLSFESAGLELGIQWISLHPDSMSLQKGESLRDTAELVNQYEVDFWVVRSSLMGLPHWIHKWTEKPVFNAGDGQNQHPTQALGDALTLYRQCGNKKLKVCFFGDVYRSRVARSVLATFRALGHSVRLVDDESAETHSFAEAFQCRLISRKSLRSQDVVMCLRTQKERGSNSHQRPLEANDLGPKTAVMHPGPVIWNQDMNLDIRTLGSRYLVVDQVKNAYLVRLRLLSDFQKARGRAS